MDFILSMESLKCWLNTPLQVLTLAPALHSLIVRDRGDAAQILEYLFHKHGYLKKLILERCWLGEDSTGLIANIVAFYPDLEVLSLAGCLRLTSAGYSLVPCLKKMSILNLSDCEVHYMNV
jgi:hypothetical protein